MQLSTRSVLPTIPDAIQSLLQILGIFLVGTILFLTASALSAIADDSEPNSDTINDYKTSAQVQVDEWDRRLRQLHQRLDGVRGHAREELRLIVAELDYEQAHVRREVRALPKGDLDRQDEMRPQIEQYFTDMERAFDRLRARRVRAE